MLRFILEMRLFRDNFVLLYPYFLLIEKPSFKINFKVS